MAGKWRKSTIGQEAELLLGYAFKSLGFALEPPGYRLIRGDNVKRGQLEWGDSSRYWRDWNPDLKAYELHQGDIVIGMDGSRVGENFARVSEDDLPALLVQRVACLRGKPGIDQGFLRYAVCNAKFTSYIKAVHTGTSIPHISGRQIAEFPLLMPSLPEQRAIACILGALDDKIELNRRMNETLEGIARAIFKSWFVDFDPVRAKTMGNRGTVISHDIATFFPGSIEDSEVGEIPFGWQVTSLADHITVSKGLSYKGKYLSEPGQGMPMHNLNSVYEGGGYKNEGLKWYSGEYRTAQVLNAGDVIVTNTEQGFEYLLIGYPAIVPKRYGQHGLFSHHIYRIQVRPTSYLPPWFFYMLLRTKRFHNVVAGYSNGTTVNMLQLDGMQKPNLILPPRELVDRFGILFTAIQERLEETYDANTSLAAIRDVLLPKLVSGEMPVPDAERIVRRCV